MWVRACVCADERHWQESTRGKALFPAPGTHTDSLLYVHSVCHYAYFRECTLTAQNILNSNQWERIFSFSFFLFCYFFKMCARPAGWLSDDESHWQLYCRCGWERKPSGWSWLQGSNCKKKKKKKYWHNNKGQTWHLGLRQSACRSHVRHFGYNPKQIANK